MERNLVALGLETLSRYVGQYELSDTVLFDIDLEGDQLTVQLTDQVRLPIDPISETEFIYRVLEAKLSFLVEDGNVTSLVLLQGGARYTASRID